MDEFKTIPCKVLIACAATGERRTYSDDWIVEDEDGFSSRYIWEEGNFACDCNRALFFARSIGEDDPEDRPCGDERFTVKITDEAGVVLYQDDRWQD